MQRCVPVPYAVTGDIMGVFFLMEILTCSIGWSGEYLTTLQFSFVFFMGFFCYQGSLSSVNVNAYSYTYSFIDYPS